MTRIVLSITIVFAYVGCLEAQWHKYQFIPIAKDMGIEAYSFTEDSQGYIYACGNKGVIRYDGKDILQIRSDHDGQFSFAPGHVSDIITAKNGILWMVTLEGYLCSYNPITLKF